MKENILSAGKKLAVMFLASLMLLGVVPIGMVSRTTTVNAEGEFLRFSPASEKFVSLGISNSLLQDGIISPDFLPIGDGYDGYYKFNIENLLDRDIDEIREAKLRVSAFIGEDLDSLPVRLFLVQEQTKTQMPIKSQIKLNPGEFKLGEVTVTSENPLAEFDLTDNLRNWIENSVKEVIFHLDSPYGKVAFAGTKTEDNSFRPCFKVITGEATDPDPDNLEKASLSEYRRERGSAYLKFNIRPENVQGAVYLAELKLDNLNYEEGSVISVKQDESLLCIEELNEKNSYIKLNLTDYINQVCHSGETEISLTISEKNGKRISFSNSPSLKIWVSDNPDVIAVTEALNNALGENQDASAIKYNLINQYRSSNEKDVSIKWVATDVKTSQKSIYLSENGTIVQPRWFDCIKTVNAEATITSGDYTRKRGYILQILPQEAPDYSGEEFSDIVLIENASNEENTFLECVNSNVRARKVGNRTFFYRELTNESILAVTLGQLSEKQNYITIKTSERDLTDTALAITPLTFQGEPIVIDGTSNVSDGGDGFLYMTYPLPKEYTDGREYISLKLECVSRDSAEESFGLYGIYISDSPYFDPMEYADKGETVGTADGIVEVTFSKFLNKFIEMTKNPFPFLDYSKDVSDGTGTIINENNDLPIWFDEDGKTIIFEDKNEKIAVSIDNNNVAQIYRNSVLYDSYSTAIAERTDDLLILDYGKYTIIRNFADKEVKPDWNSLDMSGVYNMLGTDEYYTFIDDGQLTDDSVIPAEGMSGNGDNLQIKADDVLVLVHLADPLYTSDWRVSKINGNTVSQVKTYGQLNIENVSIKNVGSAPESPEELSVICGVYEQGKLVGLSKDYIEVFEDAAEYTVQLKEMLTLDSGQTLKIFIEPKNQQPQLMTPKAELP